MNREVKANAGDEASSITEESSSTSPSTACNSVAAAAPLSITTTSAGTVNGMTGTATPTTATAATTTPTTTTTTTTSNRNASSNNPDVKRSAVKQLIERYFFQLQRGCGNPKCSNVNCASSGQVAPMTPNEYAARALQLFSQDAKLCEHYNNQQQQQQQQQPPKVARTQHESPTSSRSASAASTLSQVDTEMLSPNECSTSSSSSSGNSTITSGSSNSTTSSSNSSGSSTTTNSTETNLSTNAVKMSATPSASVSGNVGNTTVASSKADSSTSKRVSGPPTPTLAPVEYLDEDVLDELIEESKKYNTHDRLLHAINEVYSSVEKLSRSFRRRPVATGGAAATASGSKLQEFLGKSPSEFKKEDLRALQGENDKDEDSTCDEQAEATTTPRVTPTAECPDVAMDDEETTGSGGGVTIEKFVDSNSDYTHVDLESLRRVKKKLYDLNNGAVLEAISSSILIMTECVRYRRFTDWEQVVHCLVICFDRTTNTSNRFADLDFMERSLPKLCHVSYELPVPAQARLARIWATHCKDSLHTLVQCLQQIITLRVIYYEGIVNSDIVAMTKILKIVFYANLLASERESPRKFTLFDNNDTSAIVSTLLSDDDDDDMFAYRRSSKPLYPKFAENDLERQLRVTPSECRAPLVPYEEFYNEPLSDAIHMDDDYLCYKNLSLDPNGEASHFSFMLYSFILTPATKIIALYYDSRIRMYNERHSAIHSLLNYAGDNGDMSAGPDLKLKIRRDNIVNDALVGLELVAMSNPKNLKKQLVVEFVGEEGIDEGGVSKEFFQLIVEEIFNPDFGMFTQQEDTNTVWFNSSPFENEDQFTLVGIILGLAIYNNIILAVNFPMVVYRKLMDTPGTFLDLADWNPTLYRSLKSMLDYEEPDFEEVFMQTFKISYTNVFGEAVTYELKPDGGNITVGQQNKQEFVELYSDYLLNESIERQFKAFKKGFDMVTDESPLKLLFRSEEIELLVCGSKKFDFVELEESTDYEGGYTKDTQIIKDFWAIVHTMPDESKRKLLEFTTGSNRVPVGGLSRLKLLITRHGPDSDRLPTSHTCFNVLLLPEYSSKEKLEERLLKAINNSKGFGMF